MSNFDKTIRISDNRVIRYNISDATYTISEYFQENGKIIKSYQLIRWDDYNFAGRINNDIEKNREVNSLSYDFDIHHPLYIPLLHLLQDDKYLIIDDDGTREHNKKYMIISKNNTNITLRFINLLDNEYSINKFYIFIKNIMPDGRSKIDSLYKDTKERLCLFFEEAYRLIEEESHQITFEEYLLERENSLSKRKDIHK